VRLVLRHVLFLFFFQHCRIVIIVKPFSRMELIRIYGNVLALCIITVRYYTMITGTWPTL
jgi:hypothetical protein